MASQKTDDLIERGLGAKSQRSILRLLASNPERGYTRYQIMKQTHHNYPEATKALKTLVEIAWLRQYTNKTTTYQINLQNEAVSALVEFFKRVGYIS